MAALPNSNISTSLVANTLQTSSHDVGTLCTHSSINMWSKWKPINANVTTLTDTVLQQHDYGILAPSSSSTIQDALGKSWTYDRPKGGSTSPYRLGDFRKYDHGVPPPVTQQEDFTWYLATQPTITLEIQSGAENTNGIQVEDLSALDDYYLAVGVYRDGYWHYQSTDTSTFASSITINASDFPGVSNTTLQFCLVATKDPGHSMNDGLNATEYLPLPGSDGQPQTFNVYFENVSPVQQADPTGIQRQSDYSASGWSWNSITNYIGADPVNQDPLKYYGVGTSYTLQLRLSIENSSPYRYVLNVNNLDMTMSRTFATTSSVECKPIFFDANTHQQLDTLVIEAYDTIDVGLSTQNSALRWVSEGVVGTVSDDQYLKIQFSVTNSGREIFNQSVRLSTERMIG